MIVEVPLTREISTRLSKLDYERGVLATVSLPENRLRAIRQRALVESTCASCRMAGIRVSEDEVAALLSGKAVPLREGHEVLGYTRALERPFPEPGTLVTTEAIQRLHAVVLGSEEDPPPPSPWRTEPYHLEVFDKEGRALGRVIQTLPPRLIPETMEELVTWLELELRGRRNHPLLVIGLYMLYFVAVCPFPRGNGRLAHLTVRHLLHRVGYAHLPYASLERVLEERREAYFEALDSAQTHLWTGGADVRPWIHFFLDSLQLHAQRARSSLEEEHKKLEFTPLQRKIVEALHEHGVASARLFLKVTGANRNTLKDNLRRLVERGVLEKLGERRGTRYRLAPGHPPRTVLGS